ncbi:uncharacterized protein LOC108950654 [Ciona intestinalis]
MPLPLRSAELKLPNNRPLALKRLFQLRRRFIRNPKYYEDYKVFMSRILKDCSETIDDKDLTGQPGRGPDLTNNLVGVLTRFRKEEVALMTDIESMFHQFFVRKQDRDFLRFLWWKDDSFQEILEYRMKVHLFGAKSSPGVANYRLKQAADDGEDIFGQDVADFVRQNFYVDDGLLSVPTVDNAWSIIKRSQLLCARAGLRLHKFVCNKPEVVLQIPSADRADGLKYFDVNCRELPMERVLGLMWCVQNDSFNFRIELKDEPCTRRNMLSTICSIYDPMSFLCPVILEGKRILQYMCRGKLDWDDPVPPDIHERWNLWKKDILELDQLKVKRCFKPKGFGDLKTVEVHHFSDASEKGYGQCSYLRLINENGEVHCSFIIGKSRAVPLKPITIPRLELTAAVVSAQMSAYLRKHLSYEGYKEFFWVDSQVVLGYLNNDAKRFQVFVANRIQKIRDVSKPEYWFHICGKENPADLASRGVSSSHLLKDDSVWLYGPNFLWDQNLTVNDGNFTSTQDVEKLLQSETKKSKVLTARADELEAGFLFDLSRLNRFSSFFRAKRALANCMMLRDRLRKVNLPLSSRVNCHLMERAERLIILCLQREHFSSEIETLSKTLECDKNSKTLKRSNNLFRLNPFVDTEGVLRVGGRLIHANVNIDVKNPRILPQKSHITELIIRWHHERMNHMGRGITHNDIRQSGWWVIGGSTAIRSYLNTCVVCRKIRRPTETQKMANLPRDRVIEVAPFSYCAVDLFGPFYAKERRSVLKRYGVLFTCMASRAIHIEITNSLDTSSFINALRRFLARRGPVAQIRSDCGTNLVGTFNELQKAARELNSETISTFLLESNCDWIDFKFNPPHSSHMGGVWERQIRTARNVLQPLLLQNSQQLDDEALRTVMVEVENVVNSRPLATDLLNDPGAPEPITPNHLLTTKSRVLLPPPGSFQKADLYVRSRWRRVQFLVNQFWSR